MSGKGGAKKRRVGSEGGGNSHSTLPPAGLAAVYDEMKTSMKELMDQNCLMMQLMKNSMSTLQAEINNMRGDISSMKGDIKEDTQSMRCDIKEIKVDIESTRGDVSSLKIDCTQLIMKKFDRMKDELNYHEALLKNQKWEYSAPRPSDEYWNAAAENGDVEDAELFLQQIQSNTEAMRYGSVDGDIIIESSLICLPYNEEFLPHWEEFATALERHSLGLKCVPKEENTSALNLSHVELSDDVLRILSKALESANFSIIVLDSNRFAQRIGEWMNGFGYVLNFVQSNHTLKKIVMYDNPINMEDVKRLCLIVKEHPSLKELHLGGCKGTDVDGYEMLQMIMSAGRNNLKTLSLMDNSINTRGDTFISDFLGKSNTLKGLCLRHNELDDNDAISIAEALKQNTTLRGLDIQENTGISNVGWKALWKVECNYTTLNSLADSNHSCSMGYPFGSKYYHNNHEEWNGFNPDADDKYDPVFVRQKKIYSALSTLNRSSSNTQHFEDIPVELLPNMLVSIQRYSNYHAQKHAPMKHRSHARPISIIYEILQRWDKSLEVFEALSS